ncbi:MAG: hypothetical protein ACOH5I_20150 [Oligoflexus sp.]
MANFVQKLGLENHQEIVVLNAPKEFAAELTNLRKTFQVAVSLKKSKSVSFILVFVKAQKEVDMLIPALTARLSPEVVLWMAYPDGSSKKYRTEITRDKGWDILGTHGFQSIRRQTLDDDWSALCFQKIDYLKKSANDGDVLTNLSNDKRQVKKSS